MSSHLGFLSRREEEKVRGGRFYFFWRSLEGKKIILNLIFFLSKGDKLGARKISIFGTLGLCEVCKFRVKSVPV